MNTTQKSDNTRRDYVASTQNRSDSMKSKTPNVLTAVLVLSAAAVAAVLLKREFFSEVPSASLEKTQPRKIDGWEDLLADGIWTGSPDAPVIVVEFADFQCPFCAKTAAHLSEMQRKYQGQIAVLYRHFPLSSIHPFAFEAAVASECAAEQRRFIEFHDVVFAAQEAIGKVPWEVLASRAGVPSIEDFTACRTEDWSAERVLEDVLVADRLALEWTPSIIVNGVLLGGAPDLETLDGQIRSALNVSQSKDRANRIEASGDIRPWVTGSWYDVIEESVADTALLPWFQAVTVSPAGRVFVPAQNSVLVFDSSLNHVAELGAGLDLGRVGVRASSSGKVITLDSSARRLSVFADFEATAARLIGLPLVSGEVPFAAWSLDTKNEDLLVAYRRQFRKDVSVFEQRNVVLRRVSGHGALVADSVLTLEDAKRFIVRSNGNVSVGPSPFGPNFFASDLFIDLMEGQRVAYATTSSFDVTVIDLNDTITSTIAYPTDPILVTDDELDRAMSRLSPPEKEALAQRAPHYWSPLVGMALQSNGDRLWVGIRSSDRTVWEWAQFSQNGEHLGSVALPAGIQLKGAYGRRLIGMRVAKKGQGPNLMSFLLHEKDTPE